MRIDDAHFSAGSLLCGLHGIHVKRVLVRKCNAPAPDRRAICRQRLRHRSGKYIELLLRQLCEGLAAEAKVLRQHSSRSVSHPFRDEESVVFGKISFIEYEEEFAAVRVESLDGMRIASGKIPEVIFLDVVDEHGSVGIHDCNARFAIEHHGPLVRSVPVKLAEAASGEAHVDARQICGGGKFTLGYLVRPASLFDALMREIE